MVVLRVLVRLAISVEAAQMHAEYAVVAQFSRKVGEGDPYGDGLADVGSIKVGEGEVPAVAGSHVDRRQDRRLGGVARTDQGDEAPPCRDFPGEFPDATEVADLESPDLHGQSTPPSHFSKCLDGLRLSSITARNPHDGCASREAIHTPPPGQIPSACSGRIRHTLSVSATVVPGGEERPDGRKVSEETVRLRVGTRALRNLLDTLPIDYNLDVAPDRFLAGLAFMFA